MTATMRKFRCRMCGHEFEDLVEEDEAKKRGCPKCRSNSIRLLKREAVAE